ncbi:hypothetical protein ACP4OV_013025 [Aristida adscensionis]
MRMATASPKNLSGDKTGDDGDEDRVAADAEARQLPDRVLRDRLQRVQAALDKGICSKLPDGGRKLHLWGDAAHRELKRRQTTLEAPRSPRGKGEAPVPDDDGCKRVGQLRVAESDVLVLYVPLDVENLSLCATSSGINQITSSGESNISHVTTKDFRSAFGAGINISRLEISRSPDEPNALIQDDGKLYEEEFCKPSYQQTNLSQKELCLEFSNNMEVISADAVSEDIGHNSKGKPPATRSRKRKGAAPVRYSLRLKPKKEEVVLLDGDTHLPKSSEETSSNRDAMKLYYPSRAHPNSIEISTDDIRCLQPESFLSSPIMNFYIMYLQGPMSSVIRPRGGYHIFNTYFFNKLEALTSKEDKTAYFLKLRRWWKGVNIFQKAYILLPVHAEMHWSLVIVCMPAKEDETGPIILHLDSLKFHSSRLIFSVVTRFLKEEWNYLNQKNSLAEFPLREMVWRNLPRKIVKKTVEVPQQENDYDCGLFVLYYIQRFIQEAPERFQKKDIDMFSKGWFRPEEPSQLRHEISRLLQSCKEAEFQNNAAEKKAENSKTGDAAATAVLASIEVEGSD